MDDGYKLEKEPREYFESPPMKSGLAEILEAAGVSAERLAEIIGELADALSAVFGKIDDIFDDLKEQCAEALEKAEWDRQNRRENRERARFTEQRYRAEIRRLEQRRFARRIWKPPRGGGIGTRRNRQ